jgi:hypothetical protein
MATSELSSIEKPDSRDEKQHGIMPEDGIGEEYPSSFRLLAVVVALVLSMFLASLDMTIIATAIPKITGMSSLCSSYTTTLTLLG